MYCSKCGRKSTERPCPYCGHIEAAGPPLSGSAAPGDPPTPAASAVERVAEAGGCAVYGILSIVQLVLHYLGWLGIALGIIALIFGNTARAGELVVGGISMLILKYVLGFVVITTLSIL